MKEFSCEVNNNVVVKEYKAPTDDSIRVYNELKEKAISSILDTGLENFSVNNLRWTVFDLPEVCGIRIHLSLFINEKECNTNIDIRARDLLYHYKTEDFANELKLQIYKKVTEFISQEISVDLFKTMGDRISSLLGKI